MASAAAVTVAPLSINDLARFEVEDIGMRNLAIVALTDAGRRPTLA